MKKIVIIISIFLFTQTSCSVQDVSVSPKSVVNNPLISATDKAVNEVFLKYQKDLNTVGVSIGLYKNGVSNFYGYGESVLGGAKAPDKNTFFEIGSIT
jgi:CubicO group peptidase (beta-lactamase class C family)